MASGSKQIDEAKRGEADEDGERDPQDYRRALRTAKELAGVTTLATDVHGHRSVVDELLGPMSKLNAAVAHLDIAERLMPESLRMLNSLNRQMRFVDDIARVGRYHLDFGGVSLHEALASKFDTLSVFGRDLDALNTANKLFGDYTARNAELAAAFNVNTALAKSLNEGMLSQKAIAERFGFDSAVSHLFDRGVLDSFRAMKHSLAALGMDRFGLDQLSAFSRAAEAMHAVMPSDFDRAWAKHFRDIAVPTMRHLAMEHPEPTTILTELGGSLPGATLSFLRARRDGDPRVVVASVVSAQNPKAHRRRARLEVEVEISCEVCGKPRLNAQATLEWVGERPRLTQRIRPFCLDCLAAAAGQGEPPAAPPASGLKLIMGGGEGDGKRSGILRIVRDDDDDQE